MPDYNTFQDYNSMLFKEENARGTRLLYTRGHSPTGDSGDISARDPKTGLIHVSGSPDWVTQRNLGDARGWERAIVDIDGNSLVEFSEPTIEANTHLHIYRARPDVGAIVHTHGEWASVFAILGMDLDLSWAGLGDTGIVKCTTAGKTGYSRAGSEELAVKVVEALGDNCCAIMRSHGAVAVADTLDHAYEIVAWLEASCERAYYNLVAQKQGKIDYDMTFATRK